MQRFSIFYHSSILGNRGNELQNKRYKEAKLKRKITARETIKQKGKIDNHKESNAEKK